jgi:hypothetical protein
VQAGARRFHDGVGASYGKIPPLDSIPQSPLGFKGLVTMIPNLTLERAQESR